MVNRALSGDKMKNRIKKAADDAAAVYILLLKT